MDSISSIFGNIGSWLGSGSGGSAPGWQQALTGGMFGAGEVGNIIEEQKRASYQNFVMNLLKNPQQLAAMAQKIAQPLSAGLTQSVGNQVQGNLAERGLAQSPGIFGSTLAQSLAPYQQANYNAALQTVMSSLGLPAGTFQQPQNLSGLLQQFLQSTRPQSGLPVLSTSNAPFIEGGSIPQFNPPGYDPNMPIPQGPSVSGSLPWPDSSLPPIIGGD